MFTVALFIITKSRKHLKYSTEQSLLIWAINKIERHTASKCHVLTKQTLMQESLTIGHSAKIDTLLLYFEQNVQK